MLVEVTAGLVPPCLDLKPFVLGLPMTGTLLRRVLGIAVAGGALTGGPKIGDGPHPRLDGVWMLLWTPNPLYLRKLR